jgi:type VI secretion system secreted protein VgrG
MSDGCGCSSPSSGNGGTPAACTTGPCPLGNLIVHVRKDNASGSAIKDATVNISGPETNSGTTDASEKAEFKKIKPGTYSVTARKNCYTPDPKTETSEVPTGGTKEVTLILMSNCWPEDYEKEISTASYGRYSQPYKKDGTPHNYSDHVDYKIYAPVKTGSDITVEVRFKVEPQAGVSASDVAAAKTKLENGVKTHWNSKFTLEAEHTECTDCDKKSFAVKYKAVWVNSGQHYTMKVHKTYPRSGVTGSVMNVSKSTSDWTYAHEYAHCFGLPDEYSYTADNETVKYFKPDGSLDVAISAPAGGKAKTAADATIMSAHDNTTTLKRHGWNIAIEVQELLTTKLGRQIKCSIK